MSKNLLYVALGSVTTSSWWWVYLDYPSRPSAVVFVLALVGSIGVVGVIARETMILNGWD